MGGYNKTPISPLKEPKCCLLIPFLQGETVAVKMYSAQSTDRTHSQPRVKFLRADMRIRVLEIIYLKI